MASAESTGKVVAVEVPVDQLADRARRRIVVGVDGSFGAAVALRWASTEACERGLVLDVVAVWEELHPDDTGRDGHLEVARQRLQRALESLIRQRDVPDEVITAPLHGPPGERLVERARDAEQLVLGTTGISSPEIPGGISLYVLRHSATPVTFVPPRTP
ncbi:universal stress protein [Yinghuangia seranimata]|uniref:universal stress protein n=1 Tax=Yinghuangia seranimata TaxID=408067 RepID=UPI00248B569B|nr:universal stress protein [Yinghuangia seranimata]MDI2124784.1 universal stress protein [Yinghuangia seranimata]